MNNYIIVFREKTVKTLKKIKVIYVMKVLKVLKVLKCTERKNYNSFKQTIIDLFNIIIPSGIIYSIILCIIFFF